MRNVLGLEGSELPPHFTRFSGFYTAVGDHVDVNKGMHNCCIYRDIYKLVNGFLLKVLLSLKLYFFNSIHLKNK